MTTDETRRILYTINVAFPSYKPVASPTEIVQIWSAMLIEYPYKTVDAALKVYIRSETKGFAPSIGQLIQLISKQADDTDQTAEEAWTLVSKAIANGNYHAEEEFNKLPPLLQRAVGSPDNIRELASTNADTVQSVEKSHFIRSYNLLLESERQRRKMSLDSQHILGVKSPDKKLVETNSTAENQYSETNRGVPMPEYIKERIAAIFDDE